MLARTVLVLLAGAALGATAAPAGYVISISGTWKAQGVAAPLAVGAEVLPGAVLGVENPTPFDAIRVVGARSGAIILVVDCAQPGQCTRPIRVPAAAATAAGDPRIGALLDKLLGQMRAKPERYVQTISRSDTALADALARVDAAGLDPAPAFARMPAGTYEIALKPIECAAGSACTAAGPSGYVWGAPKGGTVVFAGARPGLYELSARASSAGAPRVERAWLLVVAPDRHADAVAALAETDKLIAGWGAKVEPAARAAVRRAAFAGLLAAPGSLPAPPQSRGESKLQRRLSQAKTDEERLEIHDEVASAPTPRIASRSGTGIAGRLCAYAELTGDRRDIAPQEALYARELVVLGDPRAAEYARRALKRLIPAEDFGEHIYARTLSSRGPWPFRWVARPRMRC
jgi:hypothetical protein